MIDKIDPKDIVEGVKFSDHLYKLGKKESAGSALIGLATALLRVGRELRLHRSRIGELIEQIDNSLNATDNEHASAVERAVSRLMVPAR